MTTKTIAKKTVAAKKVANPLTRLQALRNPKKFVAPPSNPQPRKADQQAMLDAFIKRLSDHSVSLAKVFASQRPEVSASGVDFKGPSYKGTYSNCPLGWNLETNGTSFGLDWNEELKQLLINGEINMIFNDGDLNFDDDHLPSFNTYLDDVDLTSGEALADYIWFKFSENARYDRKGHRKAVAQLRDLLGKLEEADALLEDASEYAVKHKLHNRKSPVLNALIKAEAAKVVARYDLALAQGVDTDDVGAEAQPKAKVVVTTVKKSAGKRSKGGRGGGVKKSGNRRVYA